MKRGEREYSSTFNRLTVDGFVPEQNLQFRSKVAVCEKGKRYALATAEGQDSVVYAVDGYIVKDGLRCDKLVLVRRTQEGRIPENWSEIFVELKGIRVGKVYTVKPGRGNSGCSGKEIIQKRNVYRVHKRQRKDNPPDKRVG